MCTRLFATAFSVGRLRPWFLRTFLFCLLNTLLLLTTQRLSAATTVVTNTNDSGPGSLRQLITDAAPGDTVLFDAGLSGQTILLSTTLTIDKDLTIDGSTLPEAITLSGNNQVRVMLIQSGTTASLIGFVVAHGKTFGLPSLPQVYSLGAGAGLRNDGTTSLQQLTFHHNLTQGVKAGGYGGAIDNNGVLTISHSSLSNNSAGFGGSIINDGRLVVDSSTFANNVASNGGWAGGQGGAIFNTTLLTVTNSTFSENVAGVGLSTPSGGAIDNQGIAWILNSTFSDNRSERIYYDSQAGGGIANRGIVHLYNSIIANSIDGPDCTGIPATNFNNLIEDGTCESTFYGDPRLGSLANHGGGMLTYDLLPGSPAIDAGDNTVCPAIDQRGVARPIDGDSNGSALCDIGAYEAPPGLPITATVPPLPTRTPTGTSTPTYTPWPTYTYTPTPTSTATATQGPTTTITPSPTTEPYVDVRVYVHAPEHALQVGATIPVTVTIENRSVGCLYAVYELTLSQLGDPIFHFDSPVTVGPPVGAQTVYTLTAVTPGRVALQASAYGERNCGDFWQWTYVNGTVGPIIVTAPLTATPTVTAVATIAPIATDTPTSAPTAATTPTPTLIATLTATLTVTPTLPATATPFAPIRLGDGNGDQVVDMADLSACVQEIFDGDGAFWQDAPGGGYPGATGCDANQDTLIDAGDLRCTALLIANEATVCQTDTRQRTGQAARLTIATDRAAIAGAIVQVPLTLTTNGAAVAAAAFRLHFDASRLTVDPTDADGDALPDALRLTLPALTEQPLITVTTQAGALDIAFTALAATPVTWYDGVLLTITLRANPISGDSPVTTTLAFEPSIPPSLGSAGGASIPVQSANGLVQITPSAALSRLYLPLIRQE